jgi:hypothetical protein
VWRKKSYSAPKFLRPQFLEGSSLGSRPDLVANVEVVRAAGMEPCNLIVMQICSNLWPAGP